MEAFLNVFGSGLGDDSVAVKWASTLSQKRTERRVAQQKKTPEQQLGMKKKLQFSHKNAFIERYVISHCGWLGS